jgi:hypothetical protein
MFLKKVLQQEENLVKIVKNNGKLLLEIHMMEEIKTLPKG